MLNPRYAWDRLSLRYRDTSTGRYVPRPDVMRALDSVNRRAASRMRALAADLQRGAITTKEFQQGMRAELRSLHAVSAAAAAGGFSQMTKADWGRVGARLKKEYTHLESFARDLSSGRLRITSGLVRSRAASYAANARVAFWRTMAGRMADTEQLVEARRQTGAVATEHCDGCVEQEALSWVPLDELEEIGSQECMQFCRCEVEFRSVNIGAIAEKVVTLHESKGGATVNPFRGDMRGLPLFAVSPFPNGEITRQYPGRALPTGKVKSFIVDNLELLKDSRYSVGSWFNPTEELTYLDLVATVEKTVAEDLARRYNQIAIYDLLRGVNVQTGGTGVAPPDLPPLNRRLPPRGKR
jgi:hypothetical protein